MEHQQRPLPKQQLVQDLYQRYPTNADRGWRAKAVLAIDRLSDGLATRINHSDVHAKRLALEAAVAGLEAATVAVTPGPEGVDGAEGVVFIHIQRGRKKLPIAELDIDQFGEINLLALEKDFDFDFSSIAVADDEQTRPNYKPLSTYNVAVQANQHVYLKSKTIGVLEVLGASLACCAVLVGLSMLDALVDYAVHGRESETYKEWEKRQRKWS